MKKIILNLNEHVICPSYHSHRTPCVFNNPHCYKYTTLDKVSLLSLSKTRLFCISKLDCHSLELCSEVIVMVHRTRPNMCRSFIHRAGFILSLHLLCRPSVYSLSVCNVDNGHRWAMKTMRLDQLLWISRYTVLNRGVFYFFQ